LAQLKESQGILQELKKEDRKLQQKYKQHQDSLAATKKEYTEMVEKMKEEAKVTCESLKVTESNLRGKEETIKTLEKELEAIFSQAKDGNEASTLLSEKLASIQKEKEALAIEYEKVKLSQSLSQQKMDHQQDIWDLEKEKLLLKIQTLETKLSSRPIAMAVSNFLFRMTYFLHDSNFLYFGDP
jgi:chromosome segregation ATPase